MRLLKKGHLSTFPTIFLIPLARGFLYCSREAPASSIARERRQPRAPGRRGCLLAGSMFSIARERRQPRAPSYRRGCLLAVNRIASLECAHNDWCSREAPASSLIVPARLFPHLELRDEPPLANPEEHHQQISNESCDAQHGCRR